MRLIASARVTLLSRKAPRTAEVTVRAPGLRTPRMVMHRCSASITTTTPRGPSVSTRASAIWLVIRSCTCGRLAYTSTSLASLDSPVMALDVRDIADVGDADERDQVMFARPVQLDVADDDHLVVVRVEDGGEHVLRALPQPGELLGVGPRDPRRGVAQAVALRVLADREQDLPDRALDARQVEVAADPIPGTGGIGVLRHPSPLGTSSWGSAEPAGLKPKDWPLAGSAALPVPLPLPSAAARASSLGDWIGGRSEGSRLP